MTALKADEKADLPTDLAVLPMKLSYRVSRNYVSIFVCAKISWMLLFAASSGKALYLRCL